jgi:hypothetical protein
LSEIVPGKWVCTSDAISKLLRDNDEWCRLSDLFHSRPSYIKARRRKRLETKQDALLDPVHSDVAAGNLVVVLLSQTDSGEWMEHQLPAKYLESPELPLALNTGQAGKLALTGPDTKFTNASLYFRDGEWKRRFSPSTLFQPLNGHDAVADKPFPKRQSLLDAARQWLAEKYSSGPGVKMSKTLAKECSDDLGRQVSERTMRRAMGRK